jgi:hypothetical protein
VAPPSAAATPWCRSAPSRAKCNPDYSDIAPLLGSRCPFVRGSLRAHRGSAAGVRLRSSARRRVLHPRRVLYGQSRCHAANPHLAPYASVRTGPCRYATSPRRGSSAHTSVDCQGSAQLGADNHGSRQGGRSFATGQHGVLALCSPSGSGAGCRVTAQRPCLQHLAPAVQARRSRSGQRAVLPLDGLRQQGFKAAAVAQLPNGVKPPVAQALRRANGSVTSWLWGRRGHLPGSFASRTLQPGRKHLPRMTKPPAPPWAAPRAQQQRGGCACDDLDADANVADHPDE